MSNIKNQNDIVMIPKELLPIWKMRLKDKFDLIVSDSILKILIIAHYSKGSWKWHRAYEEIVKQYKEEGYNVKSAQEKANILIKAFSGL
ncbi:MAG: hypothetical protein QW258_00855 [Thermoplasmata archaeon]